MSLPCVCRTCARVRSEQITYADYNKMVLQGWFSKLIAHHWPPYHRWHRHGHSVRYSTYTVHICAWRTILFASTRCKWRVPCCSSTHVPSESWLLSRRASLSCKLARRWQLLDRNRGHTHAIAHQNDALGAGVTLVYRA